MKNNLQGIYTYRFYIPLTIMLQVPIHYTVVKPEDLIHVLKYMH